MEREGAGATAAAVDSEAIDRTGFQLQCGNAACGGDEHRPGELHAEAEHGADAVAAVGGAGSHLADAGGARPIDHQLGIGPQRTRGTRSRQGEDGVVAGGVFDCAAIEAQGIGGELIQIGRSVAGLNDVLEREGAGATAAAVDSEAIDRTGFQLQLRGARHNHRL